MNISPMNTSSSSPQMTPGTMTFSSTFVHKILGLTSLEMTVDAFTIRLPDTSSSETFFTDVGSIPSFDDVLPSMKPDRVLNDCHNGACGGHLSGMSTTQKIIRAGYFWPTLFHDCIHAVKRCDKCQLYANKA
jgi:hypothetical protein